MTESVEEINLDLIHAEVLDIIAPLVKPYERKGCTEIGCVYARLIKHGERTYDSIPIQFQRETLDSYTELFGNPLK